MVEIRREQLIKVHHANWQVEIARTPALLDVKWTEKSKPVSIRFIWSTNCLDQTTLLVAVMLTVVRHNEDVEGNIKLASWTNGVRSALSLTQLV